MTPKTIRRVRGHGANAHGGPGVAEATATCELSPEVNRVAGAALHAALAAIPGPAFLVRVPGTVVCANRRGAELLAEDGDGVHASLRDPPAAPARAPQQFPVDGADWYIAVFQDVPGDARARMPVVAKRWNLTPRQSAVLLLVAEGASNRAVAERLSCSEKTVELHVSALLAKTRSSSRSQLIAGFWTERT